LIVDIRLVATGVAVDMDTTAMIAMLVGVGMMLARSSSRGLRRR
jgi:hypothetical protein